MLKMFKCHLYYLDVFLQLEQIPQVLVSLRPSVSFPPPCAHLLYHPVQIAMKIIIVKVHQLCGNFILNGMNQ